MSDDAKAVRVWMILWKAARAIEANAFRSVVASGLGLSEFAVLEALLHRGPQPVNRLGRRVLLKSGSITAAVDRLSDRQLVERAPAAGDRRARLVSLTASGKRLIRRAFRRHEADMEATLSVLKAGERIELVRLLKKAGLWAESRLESE